MTHTRLTLPQRGLHLNHKVILHGLILLIVTAICMTMILAYLKVENTNQKLTQKIHTFSTARPASAIAPPVASTKTQESLIPVDKAQVQALLDRLQSIVIVPEDEPPTLATVVAVDTLRNEVFFRNVALDDKLFVYPKARLAILYRPSAEKLVNMATLFDQSGEASDSGHLSPTPGASENSSPAKKI